MSAPTIIERRTRNRSPKSLRCWLSSAGASLMRQGALNVLATFAVFCVLTVTFFMGPSPVWAEEGMWTLNKLDKAPADRWHTNGLELDIKELYNPKGPALSDAIVQLGGGTGSFVSPSGLILTNHHVAFGALQRQSSVEINYIEDGFLARAHADEIPALGYTARVLLDIKDVTKDSMKGVKDKMLDKERHDKIEENNKKIVKKAEDGKDVEAVVASFYGGSEYYLYTYFKIKDVRIVYAPPASIGVYGGDIDNWMWPRHTGDFSFFRAYVAPDGSSAEFADENLPYQPKRHLAFSVAPLKEGDFTMVMGFPGRTSRYRSSYSIDYSINKYYPTSINRYRDLLDIVEEEAAMNPEAGIKNASTIQMLNNGYKNNIGMLEGLKKADLVQAKLDEEKALTEYMATDEKLQKEYGDVLDGIGAQYKEYLQFAELNSIAAWMGYISTGTRSAYTIYKWGNEHEKKNDLDRDRGFQDRDMPRVKKGLELADLRYDEQTDKRVLKYFMLKSLDCPEGQHIRAIEPVIAGLSQEEIEPAIAAYVDQLYAGTKVTDKEERMKMFGMSKAELMKLDDPMINFAASLEAQRKELEDKTDAFSGALQKLRPKLMELRQAYQNKLLYPDANSTIRFSAGKVMGYAPADAVTYDFQTRLQGVMDKETGEDPFIVPEALKDLYEAKHFGRYADKKLGDVPVCLLTTNDSTGGNSGSPILNGKGEVIGALFDGNYEAMASDYFFIPELTRAIHVDSRYILFIVDKFAGATELMNELTIHGGGSL